MALSFLTCSNSTNETLKRCEICSKLTIKTSGWRQWCHSGGFIVNFEHMSHLFLVIFKFEQENISWEALFPAGTININFYKI